MSNEVLPVSLNQVKAHIRELRKAKAGWVEILQMSNYHNVEALQGLTNVVNKIEVLKSLFQANCCLLLNHQWKILA